MHELGIAQGIVEIIQVYVPQDQAAAVRTVHVRVGHLSGVLPESLEFCFNAIVTDTPLKDARLEIERVATTAECTACGNRFAIEEPAFLCPSCGSPAISVTSGSELQVIDIELVDEPVEAS